MVRLPAVRLTRIGFRRDVKLFLASLVGFLVFVILLLLVLFQGAVKRTEEVSRAQWRNLARVMTREFDQLSSQMPVDSRLLYLRQKYLVAGLRFEDGHGGASAEGMTEAPGTEEVSASSRSGVIHYYFDATALEGVRTKFKRTAAVSIVATILASVLLSLYVPRMLSPIEQLLGDARKLSDGSESHTDEMSFLVGSFQRSIETLKRQEAELKRLHILEKSRADELELVSATLARSLTSGLITLDPTGRLIDINQAGRDILQVAGTTPIKGQTVTELLGGGEFAKEVDHAFEQREWLNRREVRQPIGGQELVIGVSTVPILSIEARLLGMLGLFTDLTPVRSLESRLRELQTLAELGEISAGIAHEFRNSLSTILGYLRLAQREPLAEPAQAKIRDAEKEAQVLSSAVDALLTFARPFHLQRQAVDLRSLITDIVARLKAHAGDIEIVVNGPETTIDGDPHLLARAFENVIRNAIDAIQQKSGAGHINITLAADPPRVIVEDDGIGLNPADAARYLLPFQTSKPHGFGIGLSLARKIVLLHDGTLQLTGTPNRGAVVSMEFHQNAAATASAATQTGPEASGKQQRRYLL